MTDWQDRIVGARMAVDSEYASTVDSSGFSRQEWGLVMTAVEFDIEHAEDPGRAELVADTSKVGDIMPEVEDVAKMQSVGAGGPPPREAGGGVVAAVLSALGLGGDDGADEPDPARVREAEDLARGYARALQGHLEESGSWEEVLVAYRGREPERGEGPDRRMDG